MAVQGLPLEEGPAEVEAGGINVQLGHYARALGEQKVLLYKIYKLIHVS